MGPPTKAIYAPIWQLWLSERHRPAESGLGRIPGFAYTAPCEELALKAT
jgi:hypothetical protein